VTQGTLLRSARAAFVFFTRIPVGGLPYTADEWRWCSAHLPLVGAVVGVAAGLVSHVCLPAGNLAAAVLAVGVAMALTGALHEDGLADTADALGGAFDRDGIFRILKDSRIGTFGACAVVLSLVLRAALVVRLGGDATWMLPLVGATARVGPVWQMALMPYVTPSGQSRSAAVAQARLPQAVVATGWALAITSVLVSCRVLPLGRALALVGATASAAVITAGIYRRRLGGVTGDFLGTTEQVGELGALMVMAWGRS